jgi:hypothetical protein
LWWWWGEAILVWLYWPHTNQIDRPFFLVCSGGDALWWPMISNRFHSVASWTLS